MNKYVSTILSILLVFALPVIAKDKKGELKKLLREAIANKKAQVGIAVIINGEDTITLNNKVRDTLSGTKQITTHNFFIYFPNRRRYAP